MSHELKLVPFSSCSCVIRNEWRQLHCLVYFSRILRTCRLISLLNLFYILQFYMVWQPKGLCYPILTKFNAKTSFIKNNQELKSPRRPISVWYKHGPTCLVLPKYLTVHIDVELNPVPAEETNLFANLRFLAWSRIQVINYCLRIMVQATNTGMAPTCDWMIKIVKVNKLYLNSLLVSIVNRVSQSGTMKYQCE